MTEFEETVETLLIEIRRQFLEQGAERLVLTKDGDAIWCEPEEKA